jgi:hypothetical protein
MKKKLCIVFVSIIFANTLLAQAASWCIVEKGTRFKVYQRSYLDVDKDGKFLDIDSLRIGIGEVVFLWARTDNYLVVSEISGRISLIDRKGKNTITVVSKLGVVGTLFKDVKLNNGYVIAAGSALWVIDIDEKAQLVTAMINEGKEIKIKLSDIYFLAGAIEQSEEIKNRFFKTVR